MPPMLNATNAGERDDKIALTPLGRIGKPIEVAYGILFLASDEASFVTGAELVMNYRGLTVPKSDGGPTKLVIPLSEVAAVGYQ
jgi:NAD(P)-dependent dehydrogenase (short-subunit alcohol dehydrogenase family)